MAINGEVLQRRPFVDDQLLDLLYGIPDDFRFKHRLYKAVALKHFPKFFQDIPWQSNGLTLPYHNTRWGWVLVKKKNLSYRLGLKKNNRNYEKYQDWMQHPISAN
ncbi:MAG: hypothetical protein R2795_09060 [Saprospiraceae bacterium]